MSARPLSVVIPNWNGKRYLPSCLDSLRRQTVANDIEVIVVDNASVDGSQELIGRDYPEVRLIALGENRGFTGACNIGMEAAAGGLVALLNNDTELDPGWGSAVLAAMESQPQAGIIASKILLYDERDRFHTAGDFFTRDGRAGNRGAWARDRGQFDKGEPVFSACGGAAVYRQSMLERIGLLDDDFFFLLEDVDLAWRAQLCGYTVWYAPDAIVYHHLSATGGGVTASYYDGRNLIWLLAKNLPAALWSRHWGAILARQLALAWESLRACRGKEARARLRGTLAGLLSLRVALRKREAVQAMKQVSDQYLDSMLSPPDG